MSRLHDHLTGKVKAEKRKQSEQDDMVKQIEMRMKEIGVKI